MTTRDESVIWTLAHLYAWLGQHLQQQHRVVTTSNPDDLESGSTTVFTCSCGARIDARPVAPNDPTSGLLTVTGPAPLDLPIGVPAGIVRPDVSDTEPWALLRLDRPNGRIRIEFGRLVTYVSLTAPQATHLAQRLIEQSAALTQPGA